MTVEVPVGEEMAQNYPGAVVITQTVDFKAAPIDTGYSMVPGRYYKVQVRIDGAATHVIRYFKTPEARERYISKRLKK